MIIAFKINQNICYIMRKEKKFKRERERERGDTVNWISEWDCKFKFIFVKTLIIQCTLGIKDKSHNFVKKWNIEKAKLCQVTFFYSKTFGLMQSHGINHVCEIKTKTATQRK